MQQKTFDPEEEVVGDYQPLVNLPTVEVQTGEEEEAIVLNIRTKIYRWDDAQWKERGIGNLKILKNRVSGRIRVLMRQDQTLKIVANFFGTTYTFSSTNLLSSPRRAPVPA